MLTLHNKDKPPIWPLLLMWAFIVASIVGYPTVRLVAYCMQDSGLAWFGELVEAKVVKLGTTTGAAPDDGTTITVSFSHRRSGFGKYRSKPVTVETALAVPPDVSAGLHPVHRIIITVLPWDGTKAVYGNPPSPPDLTPVIILGFVLFFAGCLLCFAYREEPNHGTVCMNRAIALSAMFALACLASRPVLNSAIWEYGMAYSKRIASAEISSSRFHQSFGNGHIIVDYAFQTPDGQQIRRSRPFHRSEIEDPRKLRAGMKLDVVYIDGRPVFNRPAWAEERSHAPIRRFVLLLGSALMGAAVWLVGLLLWSWFRYFVPSAPALGPTEQVTERYRPRLNRILRRA